MNIKVYILADHQLLIDGLKGILADQEDIVVINDAPNNIDLNIMLSQINPADVIILDGLGGNAWSNKICQILIDKLPWISIITVGTHPPEQSVQDMLAMGISAHLDQYCGRNELLRAIKTVYRKGIYFSKAIKTQQLNSDYSSQKLTPNDDLWLTHREADILKLIAHGNTSKTIALKLNISKLTVDTHRKNLHRKLKIPTTAGLIKFALERLPFRVS